MRNSGKTGSVSKTSIRIEERFDLDDMLYVFGYKKTIEKLYLKLLLFYSRSEQKTNQQPYKEWAEKNKVDFRLMPIMIILGYATKDYNWLPGKPPSRGDAVFLQLKIRKSYQESRERTLKNRLK